jgi:hypothetical protein
MRPRKKVIVSDSRKLYEDTCTIISSSNKNPVVGKIVNFVPEKKLDVDIGTQIRLNLRFNGQFYEARLGGMNFESQGPNKLQ